MILLNLLFLFNSPLNYSNILNQTFNQAASSGLLLDRVTAKKANLLNLHQMVIYI